MRRYDAWLILLSIHISECLMRVKDILNAEFLPSTLLLEEAQINNAVNDPLFNVSSDGDVREAYYAMQFHRSKMNEFMCRNYVAEGIVSELKGGGVDRMGVPAERIQNHRMRDSLLKDQGSSSYKEWLSGSMLLGDMYKHYDHDSASDEPEPSVEIESGEVTGYAIHPGGDYGKGDSNGPPSYETAAFPDEPPVQPHSHAGSSSHDGGYSHMSHGGDEHYYYHHEDDHYSSKSLALKDLFDLALTALAFLAFGVFVMNLILNSMVGAPGTTIIMTSTTTSTTVTGGILKDSGRGRRSTIDDDTLNEIAYRVMISYERLMELSSEKHLSQGVGVPFSERRRQKTAPERIKACLDYSLCQNNKFSRSLKGTNGLWIPIWSFGLSWIVGRLGLSRLETLQASVYGLGSADCRKMFPSCRSLNITES